MCWVLGRSFPYSDSILVACGSLYYLSAPAGRESVGRTRTNLFPSQIPSKEDVGSSLTCAIFSWYCTGSIGTNAVKVTALTIAFAKRRGVPRCIAAIPTIAILRLCVRYPGTDPTRDDNTPKSLVVSSVFLVQTCRRRLCDLSIVDVNHRHPSRTCLSTCGHFLWKHPNPLQS